MCPYVDVEKDLKSTRGVVLSLVDLTVAVLPTLTVVVAVASFAVASSLSL